MAVGYEIDLKSKWFKTRTTKVILRCFEYLSATIVARALCIRFTFHNSMKKSLESVLDEKRFLEMILVQMAHLKQLVLGVFCQHTALLRQCGLSKKGHHNDRTTTINLELYSVRKFWQKIN